MQVRIKKCYTPIALLIKKGVKYVHLIYRPISGLFWDIMVSSFTPTSVLRSKLLIVQTDLREI